MGRRVSCTGHAAGCSLWVLQVGAFRQLQSTATASGDVHHDMWELGGAGAVTGEGAGARVRKPGEGDRGDRRACMVRTAVGLQELLVRCLCPNLPVRCFATGLAPMCLDRRAVG